MWGVSLLYECCKLVGDTPYGLWVGGFNSVAEL